MRFTATAGITLVDGIIIELTINKKNVEETNRIQFFTVYFANSATTRS
jgi:hypothetical protein